MNLKHRGAAVIAAAGLACCACAAWAGSANRAFVSGHGTDAAGCGAPTLPCRSLQFAHDNIVGAGGEIDILDPAGYGAVTITKSLSIVNDGVGTAGVQATSGGAITINAGEFDSVYLRGLNIDGVQMSAAFGIILEAAGTLTVVNCVVRNFSSDGLLMAPTSGSLSAKIYDSLFLDNGSSGVEYGVPSGNPTARVVIDHVRASGNDIGVVVSKVGSPGLAKLMISNSDASENFRGIFVDGSANNVLVGIDDTTIDSNASTGLSVFDPVTVHLTRSVIDANGGFGILNSTVAPGVLFSANDNQVDGNGSGAISGPTPTPDTPH